MTANPLLAIFPLLLSHLTPLPNARHTAFLERLSSAAIERTHHMVRYASAYVRIPYPNGDIPRDTGVCTDEIIRAYRTVGIDLQKEVHEDLVKNFSAYPNWRRWRLAHADSVARERGSGSSRLQFQIGRAHV